MKLLYFRLAHRENAGIFKYFMTEGNNVCTIFCFECGVFALQRFPIRINTIPINTV